LRKERFNIGVDNSHFILLRRHIASGNNLPMIGIINRISGFWNQQQ